jgi:hypothetical protein
MRFPNVASFFLFLVCGVGFLCAFQTWHFYMQVVFWWWELFNFFVCLSSAEDEWRETAYEILMACCGLAAMSARSSTPKLQTQKSLTSAAASHMKKALGLQGTTAATPTRELSQRALSFKSNKKTPSTVTEIMKVQLRISDQSEVRTLRALSRAAAGQVKTFFSR